MHSLQVNIFSHESRQSLFMATCSFYFPQMLVVSAASVHPHKEAAGLREVTQMKNQAQSAPARLRGEVEHTQMCMWV